MKSTLVFFIIFLMPLVSLIHADANPLQGTWHLVKGENVTADTTFYFPASPYEKRMKIVGKSTFVTIWQDTTRSSSGFNGGTYTFKDGLYSESFEFFSYPDYIGDSATFKATIEKDKLLIVPATEDGQLLQYGIFEEWKRIE